MTEDCKTMATRLLKIYKDYEFQTDCECRFEGKDCASCIARKYTEQINHAVFVDDDVLKIELLEMVDYYKNAHGEKSLRTLRAIINGKLSKRKITPEQQTKMQTARQKATQLMTNYTRG